MTDARDAGAQYLADALRENKVIIISSSFISYLYSSLFTDTQGIVARQQ